MTCENSDEKWLPIAGWEGLYEVSDLGRVKSLERKARNRSGMRRVRERVLKQTPGTDGKLHVGLHRNGLVSSRVVHRLVLEAFVGPCPEGLEACHGPGGALDNRLCNLRWDTRSSNQHDAVREGTHHQSGKTHCKMQHAYTPENTVRWGVNGGRRCRTCLGMKQLESV